jgi:UDP:flavonoid glycosyltransferase YjiC (YdhE family)
MKRLEVGVVIKQKHWPEQLPSRVQLIEEQQSYSQKAVEIQKVLQEEDGPVNAVKALETFVTDFRSQ